MILLFDIDYTIFDTKAFKESGLTSYILYPGVKNILEQLSGTYTLGILSQGETDFQMKKLTETGILDIFDKNHIFIIPDKLQALSDIMGQLSQQDVIFVEDKLEVLEEAKKLDPFLNTIWIKNGPFAQATKSTFIPDKTIDSFSQILEVIL